MNEDEIRAVVREEIARTTEALAEMLVWMQTGCDGALSDAALKLLREAAAAGAQTVVKMMGDTQ